MASHEDFKYTCQFKERIQLDTNYLKLLKGHISRKQSSIHFYKRGDQPNMQMSRNKRFIAFGGGGGICNHKITIWHKNKLKLIKSMSFSFSVTNFQFSRDDLQIYVENWNELYIKPFIHCTKQITSYDLRALPMIIVIKMMKILFSLRIFLSYGSRIIEINVINNQMRNMFKMDFIICSFNYLDKLNTLVCSQQYNFLSLCQNNQLLFRQKLQFVIRDIKFYGNQNHFIGFYKANCVIMAIDYNKQQFNWIFTLKDEMTFDLNFNLDLFPDYLIIYSNKNQYFFIYALQTDDQNSLRQFNLDIREPSLCRLIKMKVAFNLYNRPYIIHDIK